MKKILKSLLSIEQINRLKRTKSVLSLKFMQVFARSHWSSTLYYMLFSKEFGREHRAVLAGKIKYLQDHQSFDSSTSPLLRRNIHRLEKGLIMQPRRDVFAANYIEDTVHAYCSLMESDTFCGEEKKWATDVLSNYFSAVKDTPAIGRARNKFAQMSAQGQNEYVPYTDAQRVRSDVSLQGLEDLFKQRRSTRWFTEMAVEDDKIDKAIELASLAPSACNRQPFSFFVANSPELAREIAGYAVGTGGFAHNIPSIMAVVGDLSAYPFEKDRHLIYVDASLASMQFMLALETMGLSSCPLNWPDVEKNERVIAKRLSLAPEKRVIMLIAVGYAERSGMIPYSQKKTCKSLRQNIDSASQQTEAETC